jgi:HAD superfamily hydrolase (TIGR01509 family)
VADAVVFDLDGVLVDSEQEWSAAKRALTERQGGGWTDAAETAMLGMSSTEWSRWMHDELDVPLPPDEISAGVVDILAERYRDDLPILPGAHAAVEGLAALVPLGLASSSNREIIDLVLEAAGWTEAFAVTVSSEEVAAGKPAPDVYVEACRRLEAAPRDCLAIEDSGPGIEAAVAAGLTVIAVPNPHYPPAAAELARAEVVLASLDDLKPSLAQTLPAPAR